ALPQSVARQRLRNIRGAQRLFTSEIEDKPWFYDRDMWPRYMAMLAENHFNRFNLSFGIGYDFLREVTDAYFLFAYPFFLSVPGYDVRAVNLPEPERDRKLENSPNRTTPSKRWTTTTMALLPRYAYGTSGCLSRDWWSHVAHPR
ncbi:MAG TPA: hypothetical protein VN633_21690, partial [Bryobacteraceae bacterium]|nr:hypothetical protein [Bryobacteraceae bacterium]